MECGNKPRANLLPIVSALGTLPFMNMPAHEFDLAVIGAGPAGAYLAWRAASAGKTVALYDPKAPWEKPCGGGVTHKAYERFAMLSDPSLARREVFCSIQISQTGRFFVIDEGRPLFMVSRKDLSKHMLEQAKKAGAVHFAEKVTGIEKGAKGYWIESAGHRRFASLIVGADGVRSVVREHVYGPLPPERVMPAVCREYEGGPGDPTMIKVTPFPGYIWAFAHENKLAVGAGAMDRGYDLPGELDRFMRQYFPGRKPLGELVGAPLPYMKGKGVYREKRVGERWALIGDAAGFCDTLTGEGILYVVWSADLFANAYLNGSITSYDRAWRKAFGLHLLTGAWSAKYLFSGKNVDRFFTALTVCPSFRRVFLDFVDALPSYPILTARILASLPSTWMQWRRFIRDGAKVDRGVLGEFAPLEKHLRFQWPVPGKGQLPE